MRTTIIPAQITTIEDKIAGSLSMNQILLMVAPVLWATLVYVVFIPRMKLSAYKMPVILIISLVCFILALRIKEKIILEWISILFKYKLRPRYYFFDKNTLCERQIDLPKIFDFETVTKKIKSKNEEAVRDSLSIKDLIKLETIMNSGKTAINFNFKNKNI